MEISSIPPFPAFASGFALLYLLAYFAVFRSWSPKHRPEASSCFMSLFHGTPAALMAASATSTTASPRFAAPNTPFEATVLEFSIAYFLVDLLHYVAFFPGDYLFIAHHLATLFVFVTCRYVVQHGAYAILGLLALAEVTSLCQNVWTLAGLRRFDSALAKRVYDYLSGPFYAFYTIVRGFFGPVFVYKMGVFYMGGEADRVIPMWVSVSWMVVVVVAISVSVLWVFNLWVEMYLEKVGRADEKKKEN
ncbi:hypothetical protein QJS10_CPB04g01747 [Acorus calamus]|uniref:TLC domain-containing protein n=1 Tax=Acorus calamus TaxID=4465 RepID=A0AAV9EZK9_ACOCL|nr:hypothetical protein QJS10_CPB04g01747 [Acorus calamus]